MSAASIEMSALAELLPLLRKHGVRKFQHEALVIELEPSDGKPMSATDLKALADGAEPEKCACGHATYQHTNGLCVLGCSLDKCSPDEAAS